VLPGHTRDRDHFGLVALPSVREHGHVCAADPTRSERSGQRQAGDDLDIETLRLTYDEVSKQMDRLYEENALGLIPFLMILYISVRSRDLLVGVATGAPWSAPHCAGF
jgi:hypothetical protein